MQNSELAKAISIILENPELLETARKGIEDQLIDLRDSRIGIINAGNGLVVREKDGESSSIIRMPTLTAIKRAFRIILEKLQDEGSVQTGTEVASSNVELRIPGQK